MDDLVKISGEGLTKILGKDYYSGLSGFNVKFDNIRHVYRGNFAFDIISEEGKELGKATFDIHAVPKEYREKPASFLLEFAKELRKRGLVVSNYDFIEDFNHTGRVWIDFRGWRKVFHTDNPVIIECTLDVLDDALYSAAKRQTRKSLDFTKKLIGSGSKLLPTRVYSI
jgi:hypothetical protein